MKAQQIEVGKVYIVKVSGQLANVKVLRTEEASSGRDRWVCENLETGRKVVVKGAAKFRRPSMEFDLQHGKPARLACSFCGGVEGCGMEGCPECGIKKEWTKDMVQVKVNGLVRQYGPGLPFRTDYYQILNNAGLRATNVTREILDTANQHARQHLVEEFRSKKTVATAHADNKIDPVAPPERSKHMTVREHDGRQLLAAVGNKKAMTMSIAEMEQRFSHPEKWIDRIPKDLDEGHLALLHSIGDALQEGEKIKVVAEEQVKAKATEADEPKEQTMKASTHKAKAATEKNGKAKAAMRGSKPKGVGNRQGTRSGPSMVGRVIDLLRKAGPKHPVAKQEIVDTLVEEFPGHDPQTVKESVSWYISTMKKKKGLDVARNADGYWMAKA